MENLRIELFIPKIPHFPQLHGSLKPFYKVLCREFKGFTTLNGNLEDSGILGVWYNSNKDCMDYDNIMLILIYTERDKLEVNAILDFELNRIGQLLNQQCMMYAINNEAFYVEVKPR